MLGLTSSSSSLSVSDASAAVAEAVEVRLLAGALSSRCARAKLSVDGAGGLVIIISSSSSECTRSLTIPEVVFDEVELITEILWSQSHRWRSSSRRTSFSLGATAMLNWCAALHNASRRRLFSSLLVYKVSFSWLVRISNFFLSKLNLPIELQRKIEGGLFSGHTFNPLGHTARRRDPGAGSVFEALNLKQISNSNGFY